MSDQNAISSPDVNVAPALHLLVTVTPWCRNFLSNIREFVSPERQDGLELTSRPAPFWPDVFVPQSVPWKRFRQSLLCHALILTAFWGLSHTSLYRRQFVATQNPFANQTITYYSVSEYLPPFDLGSEPAKQERRGNPAQARQEIISIPRNADNTRQTIVTPPQVRLDHDVALPNIVAWNERPAPAMPMEAVEAAPRLPQNQVSPIAPPPSVNPRAIVLPNDLLVTAAIPAQPTVTAKARLPQPATDAAVAPAISEDALRRRPGDLNVAKLDAGKVTPMLAMPEQRAVVGGDQARRMAAAGMSATTSAVMPAPTVNGTGNHARALARAATGSASAAIPPMPSVGGGLGRTGSLGADANSTATAVVPPAPSLPFDGGRNGSVGQLIALGLKPATVTGPIAVPAGNRSGAFAAGPDGRPDASATPDIKAAPGASGPGGTATQSPSSPNGTIHVGAAERGTTPGGGVVVAGPAATLVPLQPDPGKLKKVTTASLTRPRLEDLPRRTVDTSPVPNAPEEAQVFGSKKYYSMALNMPNLTSAGGSWIIRFAELRSASPGELTAPVVDVKVDPAYPPELVREQVQGTVVLYAIIGSDGRVREIRVLRSVDERLDSNAVRALHNWHFRPGTKNGHAVEIEAVVQIPFVAKRTY